jgi:hypothetical protein
MIWKNKIIVPIGSNRQKFLSQIFRLLILFWKTPALFSQILNS